MSEESYDKAKVDNIIQNFLDNQEDALVQLKAAHEKIAGLESKLKEVEEEKIYLQKVASDAQASKPVFSQNQLEATMQVLVDGSYLDGSQMEKLASELQHSPDKALAMLNRVVEFSLAPHSGGQGTNKRASFEDTDLAAENAAWGRCLDEGA